MQANVLRGINNLCFEEIEKPVLREGWVLVRTKAAGICGSDVARVFKTGTYHFPTIIGHEFAGEVVEVHDDVDKNLIGQRVAVFPLIPCMQCDNCKKGKYELCTDYDYLGSRCDGGFAELVAVPRWNLLPISDSVSMLSAAMFEPAAVALHALKQSEVSIGDTVAIIGPGTIGMILSQLAKIAGAKKVILIGRTPEKLLFAREKFGIETISSTDEITIEKINQLTNGKGVDIVIEGTGASASFNLCLDIVASSGMILAMGNPGADMLLSKSSYWKLLRRQLTIKGTWNSGFGTSQSDWNDILSLVESRQLLLEPLITHKFPLSQLSDGLRIMADNSIYTNKVMIVND